MLRAIGKISLALATAALVAGCSTFSHVNKPLSPGGRRATFELSEPRGVPRVLVLLALSGGGSRAAVFAASVMQELDGAASTSEEGANSVNLLKEVDAVSSVSGGSLTAAYYALSRDREGASAYTDTLPLGLPSSIAKHDASTGRLTVAKPPEATDAEQLRGLYYGDLPTVNRLLETTRRNSQARLLWDSRSVEKAMERDYQSRWLLRLFSPWRLGKLTFTAYDRADVMAEVLESALNKATFNDLNPERPYLFINAADATHRDKDLFRRFVFTEETASEEAKTELATLPVGRAVMASAAFPGAFAYVTLKNYNGEGRYLHLFDGGNHDNLGLETLKEVIVRNQGKYDAIAVISVDADVSLGQPQDEAGGGGAVDTVLTSVSSLLLRSRRTLLDEFRKGKLLYQGDLIQLPSNFRFCHIALDDIPKGRLRKTVYKIPTEFRISATHARALRTAADRLVTKVNDNCLQQIREMVYGSRKDAVEAAELAIKPKEVEVPTCSTGEPNTPSGEAPVALTDLCRKQAAGELCAAVNARAQQEVLSARQARLLNEADLEFARRMALSGRLDAAAKEYWKSLEQGREQSPALVNEVAYVSLAAALQLRKVDLYERAIDLVREPEKQLRRDVPKSLGSQLMTNNFAAAQFCYGKLLSVADPDPQQAISKYRGAARTYADLLLSKTSQGEMLGQAEAIHQLVNKLGSKDNPVAVLDALGRVLPVCLDSDRVRVCVALKTTLEHWRDMLAVESTVAATGAPVMPVSSNENH